MAWGEGELREFAHRLADRGPGAVTTELAQFAAHASRSGVEPSLLAILLDPGEAAVVRQRAYGRAARQLVRIGWSQAATAAALTGPAGQLAYARLRR